MCILIKIEMEIINECNDKQEYPIKIDIFFSEIQRSDLHHFKVIEINIDNILNIIVKTSTGYSKDEIGKLLVKFIILCWNDIIIKEDVSILSISNLRQIQSFIKADNFISLIKKECTFKSTGPYNLDEKYPCMDRCTFYDDKKIKYKELTQSFFYPDEGWGLLINFICLQTKLKFSLCCDYVDNT